MFSGLYLEMVVIISLISAGLSGELVVVGSEGIVFWFCLESTKNAVIAALRSRWMAPMDVRAQRPFQVHSGGTFPWLGFKSTDS